MGGGERGVTPTYLSAGPVGEPMEAEGPEQAGWSGDRRGGEGGEDGPNGMPSPEHMAARAARGVGEDKPVWEGCQRGISHGSHDHVLIGRNEKGLQLFHEIVSQSIGYNGLRYG